MALDITGVNRNLHTRATFMGLEFEDLFVVMGLAAVMNIAGRFIGGEVGGIPIGVILQYGVPLFCVPILMLFKYGKPRGYFQDLLNWQFQPKKYCALAHDKKIRTGYLRGDEQCR